MNNIKRYVPINKADRPINFLHIPLLFISYACSFFSHRGVFDAVGSISLISFQTRTPTPLSLALLIILIVNEHLHRGTP